MASIAFSNFPRIGVPTKIKEGQSCKHAGCAWSKMALHARRAGAKRHRRALVSNRQEPSFATRGGKVCYIIARAACCHYFIFNAHAPTAAQV